MTTAIKVLIAEDEVMLRLMAVELLQLEGFDVLEANDGIEALEILERDPNIALMISDVKMPRMDGYELAKASLARHPNLKILLMTGFAQEPPTELLRGTAIETLHKPFDPDILAQRAKQLIGMQVFSSSRVRRI